jgi:hypothetical protein
MLKSRPLLVVLVAPPTPWPPCRQQQEEPEGLALPGLPCQQRVRLAVEPAPFALAPGCCQRPCSLTACSPSLY